MNSYEQKTKVEQTSTVEANELDKSSHRHTEPIKEASSSLSNEVLEEKSLHDSIWTLLLKLANICIGSVFFFFGIPLIKSFIPTHFYNSIWFLILSLFFTAGLCIACYYFMLYLFRRFLF